MTPSTTIIDRCDRDAYLAWANRGAAPAYIRGLPTWMWQAALCRRRSPRSVIAEL